ncbi:GDSL-type esterase/lipase family protein [Evansella cellulosilytica]|uniref:Lipolytic protein G-D-S-L family n=1 Tax=Evansella cellulosilytica (strain ATCC 21833 / DSM 2522 / FERM P-1141 / JCM 9156 / N-4) TaxID=649639 RepID=E6TTI1_EVAC2|nr:GDSL-type esterase/lipase family protein [Evansella cellulosilytica]ADU29617.1 lipolytic protein G-D-S-L family [Evansella cellulosilytica DSM 2522]
MKQINYTALGDSLTVGAGSLTKAGFVEQYSTLLQYNFRLPVRTQTFAKRGIPSATLLHMIYSTPQIRQSIFHADIITISIGGNDLLQANKKFKKVNNQIVFQEAYDIYQKNIQAIVQEIKKIKATSNKKYTIQFIGLYNPLPQLHYSNYWVQAFNQFLHSLQSEHVKYVDLYYNFRQQGKSVLQFGIHPNGRGHSIIANSLVYSIIH